MKESISNLISVVVPVFNVSKYLERCLKSIENQTYTRMEVILVDDGSDDDSATICENYAKKDGRFKLITQPNLGLAAARNTGIRNSNGEYLTFIDSDDFVGENYLDNLYLGIKTGVRLSISKRKEFSDDKGSNTNKSNFNFKPNVTVVNPQDVLCKILNQQLGIEAWGKLYQRRLFCDLSYPVGQYYEDAEITCRLIDRAGKVAIVDSKDYFYYQRSNSINNQQFTLKKMDILIMGDKVSQFILRNYPTLKFALASKLFSAYSNVWMQIPSNGYELVEDKLWKEISKCRQVLFEVPHNC